MAAMNAVSPPTAAVSPAIAAPQLRLSVAPMMDWTDSHCRVFHRLIAPHARLYSEMVHANAVIHGDRERLLAMDPVEHPVALQLGGSEPALLAQAARIGADWGFDEINLNCGCPSDRVQAGRFGACLMREPDLVAESVAAMIGACAVPVTVKCRLGVDDEHRFEVFLDFIDRVAAAGCRSFVVHARNAWLKGLSPKENREVPPLRYDWAYRLKQERPQLQVVVNGGIADLAEATAHLQHADGAMLAQQRSIERAQALAVVTDSAADLPEELAERYRIQTVPVRVSVDGRDYLDKAGLSTAEFYRRMDENTHLHVSFDVDFLDPSIAPGVGTTVPGGPNYREAQLVMEMIADSGRLGSLDIVELNPILDKRNRTAKLAVDLVESLFGKSTLMRD